jgi:hypothetical protein
MGEMAAGGGLRVRVVVKQPCSLKSSRAKNEFKPQRPAMKTTPMCKM